MRKNHNFDQKHVLEIVAQFNETGAIINIKIVN